MSTINKSGKRFTPKIKQRGRRVAPAPAATGLTTPQATQTTQTTQDSQLSQVTQSQTQTQSQSQTREELATQAPLTQIDAPVSPVSQKVPPTPVSTSNSSLIKPEQEKVDDEQVRDEEDGEHLSDLDELKDTPTSNNSNAISFTTNTQPSRKSSTTPTTNEVVPSTITSTSTSRPSVTGSAHTFIEPSLSSLSGHRIRLNSLSIPTQLPGLKPSSALSSGGLGIGLSGGLGLGARRGSETNNTGFGNGNGNTSRRGSMIIPNVNIPLAGRRGSTTLNPGSRRGSVNIGINISRRGSVSDASIAGVGGAIVSSGSAVDEDPVPIPIMKSNKRRRISSVSGASVGRFKRGKDGVAIGGVSVNANTNTGSTGSSVIVVKQHNDNPDFGDKDDVGDVDTSAAYATEGDGKNKENVLEQDKEDKKEVVVKQQLIITDVELEKNGKWLLNRATNRFEFVPIEVIKDDVVKQKEYDLEQKIRSAHELGRVKRDVDVNLLESIKIDEDVITMKDLCKPFLPFGRTSKNFENALAGEAKIEAAKLKRKQIRDRARKLRMSEEDVMKIYEHEGDVMTSLDEEDEKVRAAKVKAMIDQRNAEDDNIGMQHSVPTLQIEDGKVTYSHESTVVDRHSGGNGQAEMERIEENPFENIITSSSYSKRKSTMKWKPQEVAELLKAVSSWGTDFGLIAQLFPHRTRKQVKAKFLALEKAHPHLIEFALLRKLPVELSEYSGKSGKAFKSLEDYETEMVELKEKHGEELKMMETARAEALAEDRATQQSRFGVGVGGGMTVPPGRRSRKAVIAEFRKNEEVVGSID